MMTRDELDELRARNRARLGLAGLAATVPGVDLLSFAPPITVETEFPPAQVTYQPGQASAPSSTGPSYGDFVLRHLLRPKFRVGGIAVNPYANDYSLVPLAKALALGLFVLGTFGLGWAIVRVVRR